MKRLILISLFVLTACASNKAQIIPNWPAAPADLQEPVPDLTPLAPEQRNLSDLIENSNENYTQYYILKEKFEGWQNWYNTQQKIWQGLQ
jgi:hypothetical protein